MMGFVFIKGLSFVKYWVLHELIIHMLAWSQIAPYWTSSALLGVVNNISHPI